MVKELHRPVRRAATKRRPDFVLEAELTKAGNRVRSVDVFTTLLMLGVATLCYGTIVVLLDQWLNLAGWIRATLFSCFGMVAVAILVKRLILPAWSRINPYYAARRLERSRPGTKNGLVNWLDLRDQSLPPAIRGAVLDQAADELQHSDMEEAIPVKWPMRLFFGMAGLLLLLFILSIMLPNQIGSLLQRAFAPFSSIAIPTETKILLVAPIEDVHVDDSVAASVKEIVVEPGAPVQVAAMVQGAIPNEVTLHYWERDGDEPLKLSLAPPRGEQKELPWTVTLASNRIPATGLWFRLAGGDGQTRRYRLVVASQRPPSVSDIEVVYEYPAYTARPSLKRHFAPISAPAGTKVGLLVSADQPVKNGTVEILKDKKIIQSVPLDPVADNPRRLTLREPFELDELEHAESAYQIVLRSSDDRPDGRSPEYAINIEEDQSPTIVIQRISQIELLPEQELVELPLNAPLAVEGEAHDDIAVGKVTLHLKPVGGKEYHFLGGKTITEELQQPTGYTQGAARFQLLANLRQLFDGPVVEGGMPIGLKVGDVLECWAETTDNREPEPNRARSRIVKIKLQEPQEPPENQDQKQDQNQNQQDQKNQSDQKNKDQKDQQQRDSDDRKEEQENKDQNSGDESNSGERQESENQSGGNEKKQESDDRGKDGQDQERRPSEDSNDKNRQPKDRQRDQSKQQNSEKQEENEGDREQSRDQNSSDQEQRNEKGSREESDEAGERAQDQQGREGEREGDSSQREQRQSEKDDSASEQKKTEDLQRKAEELAEAMRKAQEDQKKRENQENDTAQDQNRGEEKNQSEAEKQSDEKKQKGTENRAERNQQERGGEQNKQESTNRSSDGQREQDAADKQSAPQKQERGTEKDKSDPMNRSTSGQRDQNSDEKQPAENQQGREDPNGDQRQAERRPGEQQENGERESKDQQESGGKSNKDELQQPKEGERRKQAGSENDTDKSRPQENGKDAPSEKEDKNSKDQKQGSNSREKPENDNSRERPKEGESSTSDDKHDKRSSDIQPKQGADGKKGENQEQREPKENEGDGMSDSEERKKDKDSKSSDNKDEEKPHNKDGQPGDAKPTLNDPKSEGNPKDPMDTPDEPNEDHARKATDLLLDTFRKQMADGKIDKDVLDKMNWTEEEARKFMNDWDSFNKNRQNADPENTLRGTGAGRNLRNRGPARSQTGGNLKVDRTVNPALLPPPSLRNKFQKFSKELSRRGQ